MNKQLSIFLQSSITELSNLTGIELFTRFTTLRYYDLAERFPHKPFCTMQGSLDFFHIALRHLNGIEKLPENKDKEIYLENYIQWIKSHN